MISHAPELVVPSFRVDAETLRDLNAIALERGRDIDPAASIEYQVTRKDNYIFQTEDVEVVLHERNGLETAIEAIRITLKSDSVLQVLVEMERGIVLSGHGQDRAKFLLLGNDLRTLIRERASGRAPRLYNLKNGPVGPTFAFMFVFFLLFFGSISFGSWSENHPQHDALGAAEAKLNADYDAQSIDALARGRDISNHPDLDSQVAFLFDLKLREMTHDAESSQLYDKYYVDGDSGPWWYSTDVPILQLIIPTLGTSLVYLMWRLAIRRAPEAIFLFGDQVKLQAKRDKLRENIFWGVGVALGISIISGAIIAFTLSS